MRLEITYEWTVETLEDGDIIDSDFSDSLDNLSISEGQPFGLVRNEGNENEGVVNRFWAYVENGKLPESFSNAMGEDVNIKVPQKFHKELNNYFSTRNTK